MVDRPSGWFIAIVFELDDEASGTCSAETSLLPSIARSFNVSRQPSECPWSSATVAHGQSVARGAVNSACKLTGVGAVDDAEVALWFTVAALWQYRQSTRRAYHANLNQQRWSRISGSINASDRLTTVSPRAKAEKMKAASHTLDRIQDIFSKTL